MPSQLTCTASDFVDSCSSDSDFSDPLVEASEWIYEMINVKPVWESDISKFCCRVVVQLKQCYLYGCVMNGPKFVTNHLTVSLFHVFFMG